MRGSVVTACGLRLVREFLFILSLSFERENELGPIFDN